MARNKSAADSKTEAATSEFAPTDSPPAADAPSEEAASLDSREVLVAQLAMYKSQLAEMERPAALGRNLLDAIAGHAGPEEGALEALQRIVRERDEAERDARRLRDADHRSRFADAMDDLSEDASRGEAAPVKLAMAKRSCAVYLGGSLTRLRGGEFVTDPRRVAEVEHDAEHFRIIALASEGDRDDLVEAVAGGIAAMRRELAAMGHHVVADGDPLPPKL